MIKKMIPLILFLLSISLSAQVFDWEWQHPKPTGATFNDAFAFSENEVLAVGHASVISRTTDGGTTWEVTYADPQRREIESVHFPTAMVGFISGQEGLLMKTTDGGATWADANSPTIEDIWGVQFFDADTGYAVGVGGTLIKTTDGGASWTSITTGPTNTIYSVEIVAADNIFVGTSSASAVTSVSQSTDYGATWIDLTGDLNVSIYDINFLNANVGWLGCSSNKVFGTWDGGTTFTELADFGSSGNYRVLVVDDSTGYVVDSGGDINKTIDSGATFVEQRISTESLRGIVQGTSSLYVFGNYGTSLKSIDDGMTWNSMTNFLYQEQQRKIQMMDANTGYVCGGSTTTADSLGYMLKTTDAGMTWNDLGFNFSQRVYSFEMVTDMIGYAGTSNNKLFKTTDAGLTWVEQISGHTGTTHDFYDIAFATTGIGYTAGNGGRMSKTTDGGTTWTELTSPFGSSTVYDIQVLNDSTIFAVGSSAKAYKSTDGGATFTQIFPGIAGTYFVCEFSESDPNLGFLSGYSSPDPQLAKTTDGGDTWTPITFPAGFDKYGSMWGIGIIDSTTMWLTGINGAILHTYDLVNWTEISAIHGHTTYDLAIVGADMWMCGDGGTIVKGFSDPAVPVELMSFTASVIGGNVSLSWSTATETNNSGFGIERKYEGENWQSIGFVQGNGTTAEISTYSYVDALDFAGTIQFRLKQTDYDGSFEYSNVVEVVLGTPTHYSLAQNYPNPFNPSTTIEFALPVSGLVTLKVYDVLGKEVATLINEVRNEGVHKYNFDASNFASGVYLYELVSGEFKSTQKMMILK